MKKTMLFIMIATGSSASSLFAASNISGDLKILSASSNKETKAVRIGKNFKVRLISKNLNLIANTSVTLNYVLSIVPKGSNTPITFSGKVAAKATLPAGPARTRKELADLAGSNSATATLQVPEFLPEGVATLTVSLASKGAGTISVNKSVKIRL